MRFQTFLNFSDYIDFLALYSFHGLDGLSFSDWFRLRGLNSFVFNHLIKVREDLSILGVLGKELESPIILLMRNLKCFENSRFDSRLNQTPSFHILSDAVSILLFPFFL